MKKNILKFLVVFVLNFFVVINCYAELNDFAIDFSGPDSTNGETFTILIHVNSNNSKVTGGIQGCLNFDSSKLRIDYTKSTMTNATVTYTPSATQCTSPAKFLMIDTEGKNTLASVDVVALTFTPIDGFKKNEITNIEYSKIIATEIKGNDSSVDKTTITKSITMLGDGTTKTTTSSSTQKAPIKDPTLNTTSSTTIKNVDTGINNNYILFIITFLVAIVTIIGIKKFDLFKDIK